MLHSIRQFIEALQDPYGLTRTLGEIEVCRSSDGEPLRWVGNSAVVFKIRCGGRYKMLKCYTRPMEHLEAIYQEKLLRQELYVWQADGQGEWCDVVIDDWIEGITLYEAVMRGAGSGDKAHLSNLARQFDRLALELLESDWAHGDLKPENILLDESGTLRPVDFDAMFLPVFAGEKSPELGTAAYQHPGRTAEDFDASIDDYSIATISTTLHALALEPGLLARYNRGEGLLLSPRKSSGTAVRPTQNASHCSKGGRCRPLSHRPVARIPADAPAELEAARPIRRLRARNSGRPGRTLRPGRTVGFQNRRTGIDPTHIRRRFRLHRRLGRRPHGTLLAFHRPHRCRSDRLFGLQCGKTVRKRPGDRRPRRTTSGHRPQGTPNHLAYLTANNYLYPKNTCSDRVFRGNPKNKFSIARRFDYLCKR